jgi:hypothetical protein
MSATQLRQKIVEQLDTLSLEELVFIDKLIVDLKSYFQTKQVLKIDKNVPEPEDPLALWRDSDFVGSFEAEPDLAAQSEQILQTLLTQKYSESQ